MKQQEDTAAENVHMRCLWHPASFPAIKAERIGEGCLYTSWRGLTALLILVGRQCESLSGGMSEVSFPRLFYGKMFGVMKQGRDGEPGREILYMISIGRLIQAKLNEKGRTVVWLSKQIPCSRQNLYKVFKKDCIDTEMLMRISVILDYDFFRLYSSDFKDKSGSART